MDPVQDFSDMELSIVRNMMRTRSNKDIANILDRPLIEVDSVVSHLVTITGLDSFQMKLDQSRPNKVKASKPPRVKVVKAEVKSELRNRQEEREAIRRHRLKMEDAMRQKRAARNEQKYVTKRVDYSKMNHVKIDRNTWIVVNPGDKESVERFKHMYVKPIDRLNI